MQDGSWWATRASRCAAFAGSSGSIPSRNKSWRARPSGLPPRRISTPRPAMFVATVTAPNLPAWVTISASRLCSLALRTLWVMPLWSKAREIFSLFSTLTVPTRMGCPVARRSSMSSTTASILEFSVLYMRSAWSWRLTGRWVGTGTTSSP